MERRKFDSSGNTYDSKDSKRKREMIFEIVREFSYAIHNIQATKVYVCPAFFERACVAFGAQVESLLGLQIEVEEKLSPGEFRFQYEDRIYRERKAQAKEFLEKEVNHLVHRARKRETKALDIAVRRAKNPEAKMIAILEKGRVSEKHPKRRFSAKTDDFEDELACIDLQIQLLQCPDFFKTRLALGDFQAELLKDSSKHESALLLGLAIRARANLLFLNPTNQGENRHVKNIQLPT